MSDDAEFAAALRAWSDAQTRMFAPGSTPTPSDVAMANRLARSYGRLAERLAHTESGRAAIGDLMRDSHPQVRSIAAAYAIEWDPEGARAVLDEVSKLPGIVGLGAEYALRRTSGDVGGD